MRGLISKQCIECMHVNCKSRWVLYRFYRRGKGGVDDRGVKLLECESRNFLFPGAKGNGKGGCSMHETETRV